MVRIEPGTGRAQTVNTRRSVLQCTRLPILPGRTALSPAELPSMNPPIRIDSHSNGAGQIISNPNPSSRIAAPVRSTLGSKSNTRVIALSNNAAAENEMTKPSAISAGRALLVWPTDAPSRIGSIGRVQGAAIVTTPASSARTRLNIELDPSGSLVRALRPCELVWSFGMPRRCVTRAIFGSRHVFVRLLRMPQTQSDPEGGIPSGSLEVLGRLEGQVGQKT